METGSLEGLTVWESRSRTFIPGTSDIILDMYVCTALRTSILGLCPCWNGYMM
jgi:hypothetical protein